MVPSPFLPFASVSSSFSYSTLHFYYLYRIFFPLSPHIFFLFHSTQGPLSPSLFPLSFYSKLCPIFSSLFHLSFYSRLWPLSSYLFFFHSTRLFFFFHPTQWLYPISPSLFPLSPYWIVLLILLIFTILYSPQFLFSFFCFENF